MGQKIKRAVQVTRGPRVMVTMDADMQGDLLVLYSELHTWWNNPDCPVKKDHEDYYLLGNIEGRTLTAQVTLKDLEMVDAWEQEMVDAGAR